MSSYLWEEGVVTVLDRPGGGVLEGHSLHTEDEGLPQGRHTPVRKIFRTTQHHRLHAKASTGHTKCPTISALTGAVPPPRARTVRNKQVQPSMALGQMDRAHGHAHALWRGHGAFLQWPSKKAARNPQWEGGAGGLGGH